MATEGFKRKLTTLFSADVAGYSRLMGEDEAATVQTITTYRGVMSELIKQHSLSRRLQGIIGGLNATTGISRIYLLCKMSSR